MTERDRAFAEATEAGARDLEAAGWRVQRDRDGRVVAFRAPADAPVTETMREAERRFRRTLDDFATARAVARRP